MRSNPAINLLGSHKKNLMGKAATLDPVRFAEFYLNHKTWAGQREMLESVAKYPRVAVKACHASSKTFTAAELLLWWISRYKDNAVVLTTSPTGRQVEALLWGEVRKTLASDIRVNFPQSNLAEIKISESRRAIGFSTSPENSGVNIAGFHGANVLVIIDEAIGVEGPIWDAIEGARAGGNVHQLVLFNPTIPSGPVYDICTRQRGQWHIITIDAFDTPNLRCACINTKTKQPERHPDFTMKLLRSLPPGLNEKDLSLFSHAPWPELITRYWVYEMYWKYGEDSAFWEARVRGQFPQQGEDSLYSLTKLEAARGNVVDDGRARVIVGIDVAGPGKDETTICVRAGANIIAHRAWNERDAERAQGAVVNFVAPFKNRVQCINVDVTGIGHYFPMALRAQGYLIRSVNFGAGPREQGQALGGAVREPESRAVLAHPRGAGAWTDSWARRRDDQSGGAGQIFL